MAYKRKNPLSEKQLHKRLEKIKKETGMTEVDVQEVAHDIFDMNLSLLHVVFILQCYPWACEEDPTGSGPQVIEHIIYWSKDMSDAEMDREIT